MRYITINTVQNEEQFFRFTNGDEAAMSYIYNQLYTPLTHYARRFLADEFEIATIVQEAFIRLWHFRHRITSMLHGFRFLRLVIRWKCYAWYRKPANRFRRNCIILSPAIENTFANPNYECTQTVNEEQARTVWKAIPYLPPTKQNLLRLHFHYGFSCKQIASRFNTSGVAISLELQKSLEHLKSIIHAGKKLAIAVPAKNLSTEGNGTTVETVEQKILHLRTAGNKTFGEIASLLDRPVAEVQQLYLAAWKEKIGREQNILATNN